MVTFGSELLAAAVAGSEPGEHPLRHVAELPPRHGRRRPWPAWAEPDVVRAFTDRGVSSPWAHQVEAADLAHAGRHVVISTGTASGKSLAYQLPILNTLAIDPRAPTTLYAVIPSAGVFKSTDGDATWSAVNEGLTDFLTAYGVGPGVVLAIDPLTLPVVGRPGSQGLR